MLFSKSCSYGLRAVLYLSGDGKKMGIREIADALEIPPHFLGKILQSLVKNDLISSSKGKNGGFYLSPENCQTRLIDIVQSIDGKDALTGCALGLKSCNHKEPCPVHHEVAELRDQVTLLLISNRIADFGKKVKEEQLFLTR